MTTIETLKDIINETDILIRKNITRNDSEFQKWYNKTKRFLCHHFGEESLEFKEFEKFRFHPSMWTSPDAVFKKCHKDLTSVKGILEDYLLEFQENNNNDNVEQKASFRELEIIFDRFHKVAIQLLNRHNNRDTLKIEDEYDVQDLLHALLHLYFDDIREEEWTPSYAGSSLRMDFLIKDIQTVIEVKKTRNSMTDKKLSEELIIDIEKYKAHPDCKKIYCFVYDPDRFIKNPVAIKCDIEQNHKDFVKIFIET